MSTRFLVISLTGLAGFVAILIVALLYVCPRGGEFQFSPTTFWEREVDVFYLPYFDVPLFSVETSRKKNALVTHWEDVGITAYQQVTCWHTVVGTTPKNESYRGTAFYFWRKVSPTEAVEWSLAEPAKAMVCWRSVVSVMQDGAYADALEIFQKHRFK